MIGNVFALVMKFILAEAHSKNFVLFENLDNVIALIAFKNKMNLKQKMKSDFIVGPLLDGILSQTFISTMLVIEMGKCLKRPILIKSLSLLLSHGLLMVRTLFWKKMVIAGMDQAVVITLSNSGKLNMA